MNLNYITLVPIMHCRLEILPKFLKVEIMTSIHNKIHMSAMASYQKSLSTVVLNSRDRYENEWLPDFLHF